MRSATFNNGVSLTYPEYLTYLGDDNYINFHAASGNIRAQVVIGGITLAYDSQTADITFRLNDVLRKVRVDNGELTIQAKCDNAGSSLETFSFRIKSMLGKSLPYRYHGSSNVIEFSQDSDLETVDFLFPCAGTLSDNDTPATTIHKSVAGIYSIDLSSFSQLDNVTFTADQGENVAFGPIWEPYKRTYDYKFVQKCTPDHGVTINYYDTDGCVRMATGKIVSYNHSSDTSLFNTGNLFDRMATYHTDSVGCELSVIFDDVDPDQHIEDMIFSTKVWVSVGEISILEIPLQPTSSVKNDGNYNDVTINFKILC